MVDCGMRYCLALVLLMLSFPAQAEELYSPQAQCALIKNAMTTSASVAIRTDFYTKPDGKRSYYEDILKLDAGKEREVCAKGPFLPDYKVYLTVKSFVPLFDCKTKLQGEITIRERASKSGEGREVYALCAE